MEILGDLKKEAEEGKASSEHRVKDFANKLFPTNTIVNKHYKHLVIGDLMGHHPGLDGRPNMSVKKSLKSEAGQKGFLIEETQEEKSIYKWKDGKFTEADYELSQIWRVSTTQEDLLNNLKTALRQRHQKNFKSLNELNDFVTDSLTSNSTQQALLASTIEGYDILAQDGVEIFSRWTEAGKPLIKDFALMHSTV
jgi:hypothetical protein